MIARFSATSCPSTEADAQPRSAVALTVSYVGRMLVYRLCRPVMITSFTRDFRVEVSTRFDDVSTPGILYTQQPPWRIARSVPTARPCCSQYPHVYTKERESSRVETLVITSLGTSALFACSSSTEPQRGRPMMPCRVYHTASRLDLSIGFFMSCRQHNLPMFVDFTKGRRNLSPILH